MNVHIGPMPIFLYDDGLDAYLTNTNAFIRGLEFCCHLFNHGSNLLTKMALP